MLLPNTSIFKFGVSGKPYLLGHAKLVISI